MKYLIEIRRYEQKKLECRMLIVDAPKPDKAKFEALWYAANNGYLSQIFRFDKDAPMNKYTVGYVPGRMLSEHYSLQGAPHIIHVR